MMLDGLSARGSARTPGEIPSGAVPEVAFAGRSNAGKSSLINALAGRGIAAISGRPGRTRRLYFYASDSICLVDLPGYGYAEVSKHMRQQWGTLIEAYLLDRAVLAGVVVVVDARHAPTPLDAQMWEWLLAHAIPGRIVATKWDKVKQGRRMRRLKEMESGFNAAVCCFSAKTGEGRQAVVDILTSWADREGRNR